MKVALCLQGTVGNIYIDKKNYKHEMDVDYRIGLEHYNKFLMDVNSDVDVFLHCWNTKYENEINASYNPKGSIFEKQIKFGLENVRLDYMKSRWYSQKKVLELKKDYELENNFTYDFVMVSRFDEALLTPLNFSEYDNSKFYAPNDQDTIEKSRQTNMFLDYFFFSNSNNMDKFGTLYDNWENIRSWKKENMNKDANAHEDSYIFAQMLEFDIDYLFSESKEHDLVRALYEDCEYKGSEYKGIESLTKYKTYPRDNGRF